ncbi:MAG: phasin family protein [Pseudomonadota bacterium]
MSNKIFEDVKKAQNIWMDTIDKSVRANLDTVEKMLEMNKQRFSATADVASPSDFIASQSGVFKDYAEAVSTHLEALTSIGTDSRDQFTELSQEFAKGMDFSSFFPFGETTKAKKSSGKKA